MSKKLPILSGREVVKALEKAGFRLVLRRGKGSHMFLFNDELRRPVTVPDHKEIKRGTLRAIIRDAGLSVEDFLALL